MPRESLLSVVLDRDALWQTKSACGDVVYMNAAGYPERDGVTTKGPESWTKLVDECAPALLLYVRQWAGSHADAQEIVQEVFIKFWRSRRAETVEEPLPYQFVMARRKAIDLARSRKRRRDRERKAHERDPRTVTLFESRLEQDERRAMIEEVLNTLPPEQREVLVMKIWGELTFSEVADALGIPANTAASRYRYALGALRSRMGEGVSDD